ncbi:23S rRNA (adenine(1618)-N(6))-methyltransferase RlmF [Flavobacterium album]|uniref:Ribosomal RNA large subunit methyltransferase F n=1 Tax=Flavobacterium album TaxID=2175091 RepID=A0A2S1QVC7_9FLAO|nr:23S rRNA (adenine(1618)-N(6))-methyltransferase RlmF [Flavobacterium album]AWH84171.1 23S rRNA (adenine(1618)-N(6))-methyltransferase RlmF [Flavobacterium album]
MPPENNQKEKTTLHPRNRNRERYDLDALIACTPGLNTYVKPNKFGDASVDFSDPVAVKLLNKALLNHYYEIKHWDFPNGNLTPPIPGRADYIHYIADLLKESNFGRMPEGNNITCLDIGLGANCIYPILGIVEYSWNFIGSDVDAKSIASAQAIVNANELLIGKVECRLQTNTKFIFRNIVGADEKIDVTLCNPPFHSSAADAQKGTQRKVKNLSGKKEKTPELNFAGISNELIYEGGEYQFIHNMIIESRDVAKNCFWFTTLVSKQSNLKGIYKALEESRAVQIKTIPMGTGNKSTRIVAWSFLNKEEQKAWRGTTWK